MSQEVENSADISSLNATEEVVELIEELVIKYDFQPKSKVVYTAGSQAGDNYMSRTIAADIKDDEKALSLFLKYGHAVVNSVPIDKLYSNEIYFYDEIYKILSKFSEARGVKDAFIDVPKCYGTSTKFVIAFENLKNVGYNIFGRKKVMNESHIAIVLKSLARYHALCFAFKDQERECFDDISNKIYNYFYEAAQGDTDGFKKVVESTMKEFILELDTVKDKHISDKCQNSLQQLKKITEDQDNEHFIIVKGDCWSNNIMFRYEDIIKNNPTDVMLIDWQLLALGSVVMDLSYFLYTVAYDEELDRLDHYLGIYHQELSERIWALGSNPDVLYPYSALKLEWKKHCVFGYLMAVMVLKIMLIDDEEAPDFAKEEAGQDIADQFAKIKLSSTYVKRMKHLTEHCIKNNFL